MITNAGKSWYILYTRPKCEKKVADVLTKRNIECYHPVTYSNRSNDKRKSVAENLFASYIFVNIPDNNLNIFKGISGVVNFVYWQSSPAVVRNEEIAAIKQFLAEFPQVQLEKTSVKIDDMVRITQGSSMQKQGRVVQVAANSVRLELPSLGYALIARSNNFKIEKAQAYSFGEVLEK